MAASSLVARARRPWPRACRPSSSSASPCCGTPAPSTSPRAAASPSPWASPRPGRSTRAAGVLIDPPNLRGDWWGFPLAPTIGEALGLPWALGKDTNVNILAERDFGAGEGSGDLVYLTISTGIGGAVISGGQPIVGPDGVAGELGHMTVDMDGPVCGCGGIGHLEAVASGTGIANAARAALEAGADGASWRASRRASRRSR